MPEGAAPDKAGNAASIAAAPAYGYD